MQNYLQCIFSNTTINGFLRKIHKFKITNSYSKYPYPYHIASAAFRFVVNVFVRSRHRGRVKIKATNISSKENNNLTIT